MHPLTISPSWKNSVFTYVYILELFKDGIYLKDYIGNTTDIIRRLLQHQNGEVVSTKGFSFKVFSLMIIPSNNPLLSREEASTLERTLQIMQETNPVLYKNYKIEVRTSKEFLGRRFNHFDEQMHFVDYEINLDKKSNN